MKKTRQEYRERRHKRLRKKVIGTPERPRLAARRTSRHIHVQVIDDLAGRTLAAATTASKEFTQGARNKNFSNIACAKALGAQIAQKAVAQGLKRVVFDTGGGLYHGTLKALAEAARENGLEF